MAEQRERKPRAKKPGHLKSPAFEDYTPWKLEKLKDVASAVNEGDFGPLGKLEMWLCTNGRVGACNNARLAGWLTDATLKVTGGSAAERKLMREDFERAFHTLPTFDILTDLRFVCTSLCQVRTDFDGLPWLEPWKLALLERRDTDRWYVNAEDATDGGFRSEKAVEIDITPQTGDWVLLGTERVRHPWHSFRAGWNIVAPLCIGGMNAFVWWLRNAMHTSISPIIVESTGSVVEDLDTFWELMKQIGQMVYIEQPFGKELKRLQSNPMDHQSPKELKQEVDMCIAEYLVGQSLSTRMDKGGSYAAVQAMIDRISAPLLRLELAQLADCVNAAWVPRWKVFRGVSSSMRLGWTVESLDDKVKLAQISTGGKTNETNVRSGSKSRRSS